MLRPEMSHALRAAIVPPPSFQIQPVLREMAQSDVLDRLRNQQQAVRIKELEASNAALQASVEALRANLRFQVEENQRSCAVMERSAKVIAQQREQLKPPAMPMPDVADVVRVVTVDGKEFNCGFSSDEGSLAIERIYAGGVDITGYITDDMASACISAAEHDIEQERGYAAYNKGADRHEFNLAFGG